MVFPHSNITVGHCATFVGPQRLEDVSVTGGCELFNVCSLEEQQVLLSAKLSFQPQEKCVSL